MMQIREVARTFPGAVWETHRGTEAAREPKTRAASPHILVMSEHERPFRASLLPPDSVTVTSDWDAAPEFHNYEKELKKLGKAGILRFGEVSVLKIAHDDWCDIYSRERCRQFRMRGLQLTRKILNEPLTPYGT